MRPRLISAILLASLALVAYTQAAPAESPAESPDPVWTLTSHRAAAGWATAYPVGNGSLGAVGLGAFPKETIHLNHDTIWSGRKHVPLPPDRRKKDQADAFALAQKGDYPAAQKALERSKNLGNRVAVFQCLGALEIEHTGLPANVSTKTERRLNLMTGEATAVTRLNDGEVRQTLLASFPDQCVVVRLESTRPGGLHCLFKANRPEGVTRRTAQGDELLVEGQAAGDGTKFSFRIRVLPEGGRVSAKGDALELSGAPAATVIITCATDYNRDEPRSPRTDYWAASAKTVLEKAVATTFAGVRSHAAADHARLMSACTIDLGATDPSVAKLTTPERLALFKKGGADPDLLESFFQLGRHLLVGSSRPGSLPPNLQGLWEGGLNAPWAGDFHLNINVQMNMWPADLTGLSECNEPFFHLLGILRRYGRESAASLGCRGYIAGLKTDAWGLTDYAGGPCQSDSYVLGGHWAQEHLMEHYRFTRDKTFLRETAWPILKDGALFLLDWMREDPKTGLLVAGPAGSPENAFVVTDAKGKRHSLNVSIGNTHDHAIAWETFSDTLECAKILGIADDFTAGVAAALKRVPPPQVGADGRILEWNEPFAEEWIGHRHKSHLYGLHPGHQITLAGTPALAQAALKSLDVRMAPENKKGDAVGGGHTGWNLAWSANLYARLHQGDRALAMIDEQLRNEVSENLFNRCGGPFQIDGNLGTAAGLVEMLLQSHETAPDGTPLLRLLPAAPKAWPTGSARGLRSRGGITVDLDWKDGRVTTFRLRSPSAQKVTVEINGEVKSVTSEATGK